MVSTNRWTRRHDAQVVHTDTDEHVALVTRTLGVDEAAWSEMLDRYSALVTARSNTEDKLRALGEAFRHVSPFVGELTEQEPVDCAACGQARVKPALVRRNASEDLIYGRCETCGHGQLLAGMTERPYLGQSYYEQRASDGSGYPGYVSDRPYREAKGARLVARLLESGSARSLLEVGSAYGFTLQAARARGLEVAGVDINPDAERGARELYGLVTLRGSLQEVLDREALHAEAWDIVLYQFVLEHIADPRQELAQAARALSVGGRLVLVVPSMTSFELDVFGASYRSLRGDHLHLFSARSIERLLSDAGLRLTTLESHCNLHLLQGFLDPEELHVLYAGGHGPDLTVIATRRA
jgi:SAM-dependent methyltransferase